MGNTLSTQLLSRHSGCSAVASAVSTAITITPELEAARRLFSLTPVHHNNLREALSLTSSSTASMGCASTISPLLVQARHSYSNFLIQDESLKLALPHSLLFSSGATAASLSTSSTSASSGSSYISQTILSILQKIREKANQLSSLLVSVASLVLENPRLVLAGSVSIIAVAGSVYYLVIKQNVIGSLGSSSSITNNNNNTDNNDESFSELEKKLIKQKIQAQSDLGGGDSSNSFCPFENEKHNRHMSLCCPITTELFEDPVFVTSTGHTFERSAITQWILMANSDDEGGNGNGEATAVCPLTRIPIKLEDLVPNKALKQAVMEYCTSKQQQQT